MGASRPISVAEAAALKKQSAEAILKAIRTGRLIHHELSNKGFMLCREQVLGRVFDERAWRAECRRYISVPDACDVCRKTDAAVIRDLAAGRISGFKLNPKAWAVLASSAEQEFRDYLTRAASTVGRKRDLSSSRSPRSLRRGKSLTAKRSRVQSQR
jgi:hypothetical protein